MTMNDDTQFSNDAIDASASDVIVEEIIEEIDVIVDEAGDIEVIDTMDYKKSEIERIGHVAFKAAQGRRKHVMSVDKANVLTNSVLWRETMIEVSKQYPDVKLDHLYVDNAAMQLIKAPR